MTPTHEEIKAKALELIDKSKMKHANNKPLLDRLEKARDLIENGVIIREGFVSPLISYYVQSSVYESGFDWSSSIGQQLFYKVTISLDAPGGSPPHACYCQDWLRGWDLHKTPEKWRNTSKHTGAPLLGKGPNEQPWCKHLLAAFAIQTAREKLGLTAEQERAIYMQKRAA